VLDDIDDADVVIDWARAASSSVVGYLRLGFPVFGSRVYDDSGFAIVTLEVLHSTNVRTMRQFKVIVGAFSALFKKRSSGR
jgi:hypothetical protein